MTVLTNGGVVAARSIDPGKWVGHDLGASLNIRRLRESDDFADDTVAADGVRRFGGYARVKRVPWLVYVGIPPEAALAQANVQGQLEQARRGVELAMTMEYPVALPIQGVPEQDDWSIAAG